jgi:hypothetical protein
MTAEETLVACLKASAALAGINVYPEIAAGLAPYVVYTQYAGSRPTTLQGSANLGNPRFQIDAYADTKSKTLAMKDAIRQAIEANAALNAVFINDGSGYEPDTKLYRHRQDFSIWFNE